MPEDARFAYVGRLPRPRRPLAVATLALAVVLAALVPQAASAATVLGPGGWSYFGDPRAVHAGGRTFIGWTDDRGYTRLAALVNGRVIQQRRLGPRLSVDDHNNPSLYVMRDGRIKVFYSDHQGPRMYVRTTRDPHSFHSISGATRLAANTSGGHGFTYPNPLRADGALWLLYRGGNFQPNYRIERGGNWGSPRTLVWGPRERLSDGRLYQHRPYTKFDSDGRVIHGAFTEGNEDRYRNSVYYARIRPGSGLYTATGRKIASLSNPPSVTRLDKVRGAASRQWALDIARDGSHPVIVYRRGSSPREYWYARHNGARWVNRKITNFRPRTRGQVGSITLDHERPNTVYLSAIGSRGKLEVEVWVTADHGDTWTHREITRDSRVDNFRPVTPRGLRNGEEVAWFAGSRTHYTEFDTNVIVKLLEAAERLAKQVADKSG
jgi:BNR repeat-containing family member